MKHLKDTITILLLLILSLQSHAESTAVGQIFMTVVRSLSIVELKAMAFDAGFPGAGESTIVPGNKNSSAFKVQGQPNMSFQIQLPTEATLSVNNGSSPDETIRIYQFASLPTNSGNLNEQGEQTLYVGATRKALSSTQFFGTYTGSFQVTIIY